MNTLIAIIIAVAVFLFVGYIVCKSGNDETKAKCPRCGSPLQPFINESVTGMFCAECDWWEGVDNYGNKVP